jgi:hypothetical protein
VNTICIVVATRKLTSVTYSAVGYAQLPPACWALAGRWEYFLLQVSSRLWLAVWETRKLGTATAIVVRLDKVKNILLLSFLSSILG